MTSISGATPAPYAPVGRVIGVIRKFRERRIPEVIDVEVLVEAGVPPGNAPRTLAALRFLRLVGEDGGRTEAFSRLSQATSEQYREQLAQVVRAAYALIFRQLDPAEADELELADAFRQYQPHAQRDRMLRLFVGLCQEAGVREGTPGEERRRGRGSRSARPAGGPEGSAGSEDDLPKNDVSQIDSDLGLLATLFQQLPSDRYWSRAARDRWLRAFEGNLDLVVQIED